MPLLRQAPFVRKRTPKNLPNDVPLYYLDLTGEVFTEYEEFCYRIIQCNSLVWTCAETGKTELTFAEALESEAYAQRVLSSFPEVLKVPALYLASIAQITSFSELVTDVFKFIQDHFFIDEIVESKTGENWKQGRVISVQKPETRCFKNKKSFQTPQSWTPPGWYVYTINISNSDSSRCTRQVCGAKLRRPESITFSKDMLWTFLKQNAVLDARGIWVIKGYVLVKFNIQHVKYSDIFVGDPPMFAANANTIKTTVSNKEIDTQGSLQNDKPSVGGSSKFARQPLNKKRGIGTLSGKGIRISDGYAAPCDSRSKTNDLGLHKQSRQQNIEKYFTSSKKSSPSQNQDKETFHSEVTIKLESVTNSSDSSVKELVVYSEEEDNSSGDEIRVVWSSTIRPRRSSKLPVSPQRPISLTPHAQELLNSLPKCTVSLEFPSKLDSFPIIPKEEPVSDEEVSKAVEVCEKPKQSTQKLPSTDAGKTHSAAEEELMGSQYIASPDRKKMRQTAKVDWKPSVSHSIGNKRKDHPVSHKVPWKKSASSSKKMKKQKVVATLKPWVQSTNAKPGKASSRQTASNSIQLEQNSLRKTKKQKVVATLKPWVQSTDVKPDKASNKLTASDSIQLEQKVKKKNWLQIQRDIEIQEKLKKQEERLRMKAKQEEEKLKFAKFMKEWRKNREDLLCEDSKPLPIPCEIKCELPNECFGEFVMILEFLNSFKTLLKVRNTFPNGMTFELLERALLEKEVAGPLHDLIKLLLSSIFYCQDLEYEKPKSGVPMAVDLNLDELYDSDMSSQKPIPQCVAASASGWSNVFQGVSLRDIPLNPVTISEVLRLHFMGSGGRAWDSSSRWLNQRGGYTNLDDPGLWFRIEKPTILLKLSYKHVCELSFEEKLDILGCLINQVLTYAAVRDILDVRSEQMRRAKTKIRSLQIAEIKLQKEAAARRIQEKKGAKLLAKGTNDIDQIPPHEKSTFDTQKIEKELSKLRTEIDKSSTKILPLTMSHQLLPIGSDRAHRNYWLFSSLPGLYVEYNPFDVGPCLPEPTPLAADLADTLTHVRRLFEEEAQNASSDKENDGSDGDVLKPVNTSSKKMLGEQNISNGKLTNTIQEEKLDHPVERETREEGELLVCTASENCPVHCTGNSKSHWRFFAKQEDITRLLECLNERGIRESALRRILMREKQRVSESIAQCPVHKLNPAKFQFPECEPKKCTRSTNYKPEATHLNYPPGTPISYIMEHTIRELILELENKVTSGCVGSLKVCNLVKWRAAIENGEYDKQSDSLVWGFKMRRSLKKEEESEDKEKKETVADVMQEKESEDREKKEEAVADVMQDEESEEEEKTAADVVQEEEEEEEKEVMTAADKKSGEEVAANEEEAVLMEDTISIKNSLIDQEEEERGSSREERDSYEQSLDLKTPQRCPEEKQKILNSKKSSDEESIDTIGTTDESAPDGDQDTDQNNPSSSRLLSRFNLTTPTNPVIKDLASALLQIEQSIDYKFLEPPLAGENKEKTKTRLMYWEVSLMNSINFSQIFIHYSTLENSINWSISTLNAPCCICKRKGDAENMLLCDGCNKGHHIYCLKPKLNRIPKGDWFCPICTEYEIHHMKDTNKRSLEDSDLPPSTTNDKEVDEQSRDQRRKILTQGLQCNSDALVEQSSQLRPSAHTGVCNKCQLEGTVIVCSSCLLAYHPQCLKRPIRLHRLHQENWRCESCKALDEPLSSDDETDVSEEYDSEYSLPESQKSFEEKNIYAGGGWQKSDDELSDIYPEQEDTLPVRERRECASAALAKIATFTKMLRSNSLDDDGNEGQSLAVFDPDMPSSSSSKYSDTLARKRSRRALYASGDFPLDNAVLQDLMTDLIHHNDAWPFLRPVRRSEVPDYHKVIKKSMDLGTVKFRLNTSVYKANKEFISDIILIFKNCYMYNHKETIEFQCGERLRAFFEEKCRALGLSLK